MPYPYNLEEINKRTASDPEGYAQECEAIYNRKVMEAAASIQERIALSNVVFLSGPSGSGKTTTAKKICDAIEKLGVLAHTISLDKYYIRHGPETAPRTEDGEYDFESPYCLDLEMLKEHFDKLERGEEVIVPHFSFKLQERDPKKEKALKLGKDEIVIFEGIHALNDLLADEHPDAFKLYISARSDIVNGGEVFFKRTWTRLLRRVVRDSFFRGWEADETLKKWANVRTGEKTYISPFKYKADLLFDSSMGYEVPIMKQYAVDVIKEIPGDTKRAEELCAVLPALEAFEQMDSAPVPVDSILREFIGGGKYKY